MRSFLVIVTVGILVCLVGCGGSSTPSGVPITITLSPTNASVHAGQSLNIVAAVSNDSSGKGVNWSLSGVAGGGDSLTSVTPTSATYNAPVKVTGNLLATVTATSVSSPTVSASLQITVLPAGTASNVQPISVNGGPVAGSIYPNGAFTSVTLCLPSTNTCQTIDGILVDTGSFGLRVLASQVTIPLQALNDGNGNELNDCVQFADLSFLWGTVAQADVVMAGEVAGQTTNDWTTVHLIANPTSYSIPVNCSSGGINENTQDLLGANGILGVGPAAADCGFACDPASGNQPPEPAYYLCGTASGCAPVLVGCGDACGGTFPNQQVTNPVFNFPIDNNGVVLELPAVAGGVAATLDGPMVFGIGTQSNNGLGAARVLTMDSGFNFTTTLTGQSPVSGFIDSGSNGLFFMDTATTGLPTCSDPNWYCPANTTQLSATQTGTNNVSSQINFSVDNFDNVTQNNPGDAVFGNLAGPFSGGFDWGLPFFYGRSVFTAIDGTNVGVPGPFWAY